MDLVRLTGFFIWNNNMNDKKYYWLRLKEDFFNLTTTKLLRKMPEGDLLTIIYLKLQLLSLKNNGNLIHQKLLPNLSEELAIAIDEDSQFVALTIATLEKLHLIECISNDEYLLTAMKDLIGTETKSAIQKREYRKKLGQIEDINRTLSDREEKRRDKEEIKIKKNKKENFDYSGFLTLEIESIKEWLQYKKERKQSYTLTGLNSLRKKLLRIKDEHSIIDAIQNSIANNYAGVFADKKAVNKSKEVNPIDPYIDSISGALCGWFKDQNTTNDYIPCCFHIYSDEKEINRVLEIHNHPLRYNDLPRRDTNEYSKNNNLGYIGRDANWNKKD